MRYAFTMFGAAASSDVTIAKYCGVGYDTLKRRCKQLYEYRGEWPFEFMAALATVESAMSYLKVNPKLGAAGLFQITPVTASFLRVPYNDMKKSVVLQLRAGKKLLADSRARIKAKVPEVLEAGGDNLYAVAYLYHNQGIGGAPRTIDKCRNAGKEVTWDNLRGYVGAGLGEVIDRLIALASLYQERYAELVEDAAEKVAQYEGEVSEAELRHELLQQAEEGDGDLVALPSSLDDYGPAPLPDGTTLQESVSTGGRWVTPLLIGLVAAAVLGGGGYVLWRSRRKRVTA